MNINAGYDSHLEDRSIFTTDCSFPFGHGVALMTIYSVAAMLYTYWTVITCPGSVFHALWWEMTRLGNFFHCLTFSMHTSDLIVSMVCEPLFVAILGGRVLAGDCSPNLELAYVVSSNLAFSTFVMHVAAIIVDRFLGAFFPLHHGRIMQKYSLKTMLIAVWGAAFVFNFCFFRVPFTQEKSLLVLVSFVVSYCPVIGYLVWTKERRDTFAEQRFTDSHFDRRHVTITLLAVPFVHCCFRCLEIRFCQDLLSGLNVDSVAKLQFVFNVVAVIFLFCH